jgi:hypothetical protein
LLKENQLSQKNRDSKEYAIEAGRLLPAEYVVIGSVTFREKYYIQITVVEVKSGTLIYSFNKDYESENTMYNESEAIRDGIENKIYESAPIDETSYPVKNNFYLNVNSGYIPPVRKAEEFSEGGFIINSEFGIRNLFTDNFNAGLYAGYSNFYGDGAINYSSMIPLLVTSSYKIGNNRFKVAPGFGIGTAFITIDKESGSEKAFEPCALLFIKGDIFINLNIGIEISANYYTIYEPEGNIDFISYNAGIISHF